MNELIYLVLSLLALVLGVVGYFLGKNKKESEILRDINALQKKHIEKDKTDDINKHYVDNKHSSGSVLSGKAGYKKKSKVSTAKKRKRS